MHIHCAWLHHWSSVGVVYFGDRDHVSCFHRTLGRNHGLIWMIFTDAIAQADREAQKAPEIVWHVLYIDGSCEVMQGNERARRTAFVSLYDTYTETTFFDRMRRQQCNNCKGTDQISDGYEYLPCGHCEPRY